MDELGARAQYCGFLDAIYRRAPNGSWLCGHGQATFDDLPLDQGVLLGELSHEVNRILAAIRPDLVLTCAAIGDHIDHRLTTAAVRNAVHATEIQTLLWEDLPYAINRPPVTTTSPPAPITSPQAWHRKWRSIACYPTQLRMLWPTDTDWVAELRAHAMTRGEGVPTELTLPLNS